MNADFLRDWQIDWKRVGDYLLGRSMLIGIASLLLLFISGYATWHGMRDFIVGVSTSSTDTSTGLSISNDLLVILVVAALTFLMWLALRETFGSHRRLTERTHYNSALSFPRHLVDRVWLWILVEPDCRRGSDAQRPGWAARRCARCKLRYCRAP